MTKDELAILGQESFGRSWKSELASRLGVYIQTVNRWASGYTPISRQVEFAIRYVCEKNSDQKNVA